MIKRSIIDLSLTILEAMKDNPVGTSCSVCGQDEPLAHNGIKACLCSRCTYAKADKIVKEKEK